MKNHFENITDYVNQNLNPEERLAFEAEMEKNEALKRAVQQHDIVEEALDYLIEEDIRSEIRAIGVSSNSPKREGWKTFLLLLFICSTLAIIALLLKPKVVDQPAEIYASFYTPYIKETVRGSDKNDALPPCLEAHRLMEQDLLSAKKIWQTLQTSSSDCPDKATWYLSLIYLKEGNFEMSSSLITDIVEDRSHTYNAKAVELSKVLKEILDQSK